MTTLRTKIARLAQEKPGLRAHLVPLLRSVPVKEASAANMVRSLPRNVISWLDYHSDDPILTALALSGHAKDAPKGRGARRAEKVAERLFVVLTDRVMGVVVKSLIDEMGSDGESHETAPETGLPLTFEVPAPPLSRFYGPLLKQAAGMKMPLSGMGLKYLKDALSSDRDYYDTVVDGIDWLAEVQQRDDNVYVETDLEEENLSAYIKAVGFTVLSVWKGKIEFEVDLDPAGLSSLAQKSQAKYEREMSDYQERQRQNDPAYQEQVYQDEAADYYRREREEGWV